MMTRSDKSVRTAAFLMLIVAFVYSGYRAAYYAWLTATPVTEEQAVSIRACFYCWGGLCLLLIVGAIYALYNLLRR
jgi:uncharacterized membrane protein